MNKTVVMDAAILLKGVNKTFGRTKAVQDLDLLRSITVTRDAQRETVQNFNLLLPAAFGALLLGGVVVGEQSLLASTVEEKSSRVMEVLLSAVSPKELMAGKLLGQMAVSLIVMSVYLVMGLAALSSSSLLALVDLRLIVFFRDPRGDYPACAEALLQGGAQLSYADFGSEAVQAVLKRHAAGN